MQSTNEHTISVDTLEVPESLQMSSPEVPNISVLAALGKEKVAPVFRKQSSEIIDAVEG
jgi:hypothetical protein